MMNVYSIEELHQGFKTGQILPENYYQEIWHEAQYQQKRLNAFALMTFDKAQQDLKHAQFQNILSGIPYVLKDNFNTKGIYTTASSRMLADYLPVYNAHIVDLLEKAECCLIGKASMDELGMGTMNMTALTGPVLNPWNIQRVAGGSSGGCAALVGSGVVPFAIGSDTGDSIRRPAGFCGIVGMKPTWGLISRYGLIPYAASLDTVGAMTRSVKDMSIVLENIAGYDEHDMTSCTKKVPSYYQFLSSDISHLKIAVIKNVYERLTDSRIKEKFMNCVSIFKRLGATIHEVEFPDTYLQALSPVYQIIANGEATSQHACLDGIKYGLQKQGKNIDDMIIRTRSQGFHQSIQQRFILGSLALKQENQEKMFRKAQQVRRLIVNSIQDLYRHYDIILTPNGEEIAPFMDEAKQVEYTLVDDFLIVANLAGLPSLTLPCGFVDHMPVAIHIMGRCFEEQTVLNCAYALEKSLSFSQQYCQKEIQHV